MTTNDAGLGNVQLHLVNSVEKSQEFLTWLGQRRPYDAVSIDIETGERPGGVRADALSPWHGQMRLVQVGDGEQGWAIPWEDWSGVFYQGLENYDGQIVCHNIAFEARWFDIQSRWKMPWHKAHDTMIMAHLIDPLGSGALKTLTSRYIDPRLLAYSATSMRGWLKTVGLGGLFLSSLNLTGLTVL
jgi:hypothetical protein